MDYINGEKVYFADLHIHSRFSRACSKQLNIANLEKWAKVKGLDVLGTGDFTHPEWLQELKNNLEEKEGIFYTKRRNWDVKSRLLSSIEKAEQLLGYRPQIAFEDGVKQVHRWFVDNWENIDRSAEFLPKL